MNLMIRKQPEIALLREACELLMNIVFGDQERCYELKEICMVQQ